MTDDRLRLIFTCCHPALGLPAPGRAHPAPARRADHAGDRPGVPGARGDDGAADRPGQGARSGTRASRTGCPRDADLPGRLRRGARRPLPDLQRGLRRQLRRRPGPGRPVRRGDPAGPAAGRADAGRAGGARPARPDAADRRPPGRPDRPGRRPGAAAPSRTAAAGTPPWSPRGTTWSGPACAATRPARTSCRPRSRRCTATPSTAPPPPGTRSSGSTTSCWCWPRPRWPP